MANPILVTGAAGRVGAIGRTVTELLLQQGKAVRAMVRNEDERAQALRAMGAEVVLPCESKATDILVIDPVERRVVRTGLVAAPGQPVVRIGWRGLHARLIHRAGPHYGGSGRQQQCVDQKLSPWRSFFSRLAVLVHRRVASR